ncbi:glycerophosphodiester phosphodiesterase family protein [Rhizobium hainanense]|uniref:Glycerophosphoryl diester phosphodiesterase n=1 Tax=Rhizobium hainanense TaxID=52131 RepID=A0A1C3UXU7_9HYPH|nr:glycerophosphodiester phosphodiesterase family protein [Rhizobium hainanense]SCB20356.1 glycerophosphoryl diester phosphodiesterase [Rhizobium hainanense]
MDYADYIADPSRDCAIVVHRGIWRAAPENSLLAIDRAISAGYDAVEIDVRCSSDGEFFLLHDDTLERTAGLAQEAEGLTLHQLSSLPLRDRDGGEANRMTREKLPSLKDVFDLTRGRIFLHLDVKRRDMIPGVIACARAMGVDRQVDFWGDLKTQDDLAWIRSNVWPEMVLFMAKTRLGAADAENQLDLLFRLNPLLCEIYFDTLDQLAARKALFVEAGVRLWVNTLDSVSCAGFTDTAALEDPAAIWGRLIDMGVSAIQTDEAEALKTYLKTR